MGRKTLAWRVTWATAAVYAVTLVWAALWLSRPSGIVDLLALFGVRLAVLALYYWCCAILIKWRYKNEHRQNWHVWTAWFCTTVLLVFFLANGGELEFIISADILWWAPLAALVGVVIGEISFRLFDRRLSAALEQVKPKLAARRWSIVLLIIFLAAPLTLILYRLSDNKQPAPGGGGILQQTNAMMRTGKLPYVFSDEITVQGCKDPADTLLWINIVTGRLYERDGLKDGAGSVKPEMRQLVSDGISAFHRDKWEGCHSFQNNLPVLIEGPVKTLGGLDLLCLINARDGLCYWVPAQEIELGKDELNKK